MKKEKIKKIKRLLNAGFDVEIKTKEKTCLLWINENKKYIYFQSAGQSAIKNNVKELTWFFKIILNDLPFIYVIK